MARCCSSPTPTPTTSPSSASRTAATPSRSGFIPVGWYPTAVRYNPLDKHIYVANGKGVLPKANRHGPNPLLPQGRPVDKYIAGLFSGTLSIIPMPGPARMASTATGLRVQSAAPRRRRHGRAAAGQSRSRPRSATPALSSTSSTSSRKTERTIRSSATFAAGQRRSEPVYLPGEGDAQPSQAGAPVRAAGQPVR